MREIYLSEGLDKSIKCHDQVIFKNGESGKRIWEAGIVMARFLHDFFIDGENQDKESSIHDQVSALPGLDEESLWDVKQILELGSGTGIGVMPLVNHYAKSTADDAEGKMPHLR